MFAYSQTELHLLEPVTILGFILWVLGSVASFFVWTVRVDGALRDLELRSSRWNAAAMVAGLIVALWSGVLGFRGGSLVYMSLDGLLNMNNW